jgi:glyoxylase-like metal-dependent hydrolase (beta-lactamase superfamily II)
LGILITKTVLRCVFYTAEQSLAHSRNFVLCCPTRTNYRSSKMTSAKHINVRQYEGGVSAIDTGFVRDQMAASYLVDAGPEIAFIEVGTNSTTPILMDALKSLGRKPEDVRYVIVTHVHLDHAGGAGSLMQLLPKATFLVHPYGARHMIDPTKLEAGARAVYGDQLFDKTYGTLIPVPEERVQIMEDGDEVTLGNRQLHFIDTPGHARHHFCVRDSLTNGWFTGDTFGLSYREFDTENGPFLFPTTTPIQFDPQALKESVSRLRASNPDCMYLTHYGRVDDVQRLADDMIRSVDVLVELAERYKNDTQRQQKIEDGMRDWLMAGIREHGVTLSDADCLEVLMPDVKLNTQGIEFWLEHRGG